MLRLLVGAMLLALTFAGGYAVAAHKTVKLTVDGSEMTVATMKSRVIDVVKENGFSVGDRDDLYPGQRARTSVRIDRAAPQQAAADLTGRREQPTGVDHRVDRRRGAGATADV